MRISPSLALGLVLLVGSCSGQPEPSATTTTPPAAAASTPLAALTAADDLRWTGDLDGMIERRYVRMLVTFSRTNYFLDRAEQRGITYEMGKLFEAFLNERLRSKQIRVQVAFIPMSRDRLLPALAEGRGDIAAANLTITPERLQIVDFATPVASDVREVVVTAADQPPLASAEDLSGREVHVRRSSSYYESLAALNETLRAAGRAPVVIFEASEALED